MPHISLKLDGEHFLYFKLILFDKIEISMVNAIGCKDKVIRKSEFVAWKEDSYLELK